MYIRIAFTLCFIGCIYSRPVEKIEHNEVDVNKYLMTYGYLSDSVKPHTDEEVKDAVAYFQEFVGLEVTGIADEATVTMMQKPRCGMKDVERDGGRQKRFVHKGGKWRKRTLVYGVWQDNYPRRMTQGSTNVVLREAFQLWEDVTGLTFQMATRSQRQNARSMDIAIRFARREHGDGAPFDGPWGVMAHAFFPFFGGNIHFDDDEYWTAGRGDVNFKQIAVHEIGHSLGLGHSNNPSAVMAPMYMGYNPFFKLHADDINGVQQLYGGPGSGSQGQDDHDNTRGSDPDNITDYSQPIDIQARLDFLGAMQGSAAGMTKSNSGLFLVVVATVVVMYFMDYVC